MQGETGFRITPRLVFGLTIMAAGILFTLDNMGYVEAGKILPYWPVILIMIGLTKLFGIGGGPFFKGHFIVKVGSRNLALWALPAFTGALIWILAGSLLLARNTHLLRLQMRDVLAALLVLVGAYIVLQTIFGHRIAGGEVDSGSTLSAFALMSGVERRVASQGFRGGEATAVMGGCEIDLRPSTIAEGPAVIECFALWGGIDLIVPEDWMVTGKVIPLMGGFEDNTKPATGGPRKELIVRGLAIMGGVEVRNK